jgi:cytochrome P450
MISPNDLLSEQARIDPYPMYADLRERNEGVHYLEPLDFWVALRYDQVQRLSTERTAWSSDMFVEGMGFGTYDRDNPVHQRYAEVASRNLMIRNAPDHTRLRALLNHAFTGRAIKLWGPAIQAVTDEVLGSIEPGAELDAMAELAEVVPVWVISKLIGVPIADREQFRGLSVAFTETFDPTVLGDRRDRAIRQSVELFEYVKGLAIDRTRAPGEDLLTTLIQAEEDGTRLSMDELIASVCMLLVAGNETTADLIATGLALFMAHPDQFTELREDPTLIGTALLEVLRYESPLQFSPRIATEDLQLGSESIPKGGKVIFGHGSGNRDPRQYQDPETFDIRRGDKRHLAFAAGAHFCIGNQLALSEGEIFFRTLFDRFGEVTPAAPGELRTDRLFQHGYAKLPVTITGK